MKFTYFHQKQCGIYTLANTNTEIIGTTIVGPCITLFIYHPTAKSCFAFHIDDGISIQAIQTEIKKYISDFNQAGEYIATLVGGWPSLKELRQDYDVKLVQWLHELGMKEVDVSMVDLKSGSTINTGKEYYYNLVALNLSTGQLIIKHTDKHDMQPVAEHSREETNLIIACMEYLISHGSYHLDYTIKQMMELRNFPYAGLPAELRSFYEQTIETNNATPVIPRLGVERLIRKQLHELGLSAQASNLLDVLRHLYSGIANPVSAIPTQAGGFTPLHYACNALKQDPLSFPKQSIVFMILSQGRRDLANDKGRTALDMLPADHIFTVRCKRLLNIFKNIEPKSTNHYELLEVMRRTLAMQADEMIEYTNYPAAQFQTEIKMRFSHTLDVIIATFEEKIRPATKNNRVTPNRQLDLQ